MNAEHPYLGGSWCRRATAMLLAVVLTLTAGMIAAPEAHAAEGIKVEGHTTYRLDPVNNVVRVSVKVRLENTMPSETVGAYIRTPYLDTFTVPTMGPVRKASARSSSGGKIPVSVVNKKAITLVVADLTPNLVHGTPQTLTIEFDLPGQPPRSKSVTRVNNGFASWFMFATGDPGKADIKIDVPHEYEVSLSKAVRVKESQRGNRGIYEIRRIRKLENAVLFASASNEDRLDAQAVDVETAKVTVKAWPGDSKWTRFATRWVSRGLPVLEKLIGLEAPEDELSVVESSRSYQLGYAGFYVPVFGVVEVGDELDEAVLLHELSHVWFNREMFSERWIAEGLAEEMSNQALDELGEKRSQPKRVDPDARGSVALNAWPPPAPLDPRTARIEDFAYQASYSIMHDLADEVGIEGMRKIMAAATKRSIAYQGESEPEEFDGERDWRYFYDLAQIVAGSRTVEKLFTDFVLTDKDVGVLRLRTEMRAHLADLEDAGDGWSPPLEVRSTMAEWDFGRAETLIDKAHGLLERSKKVSTKLAGAGMDAGQQLERQYEESESLTELEKAVGQYEEAADKAVAVRTRWDSVGPLGRLGLVGADSGLDEANAALAKGEPEQVAAVLASTTATIDGANARGINFLLVVLLVAAVGGVLVRRRRSSADPQPAAE